MIKCNYCKRRRHNSCRAPIVHSAVFFNGNKSIYYYAPNILNKNNACEFFKANIKYKVRKAFGG